MQWTLWASGLTALAAAVLFLRLGVRLRRQAVGPQARPLLAFSTWWLAIAAATAAYGLRVLLAGSRQAVVLLLAAGIALSGLAIWGLVAYVGYVYTGTPTVSRAAGAFYAVAVPATLAYIAWASPHRIVVQAWTVEAVAAPAGPLPAILLTLAFLVPPLVASLLVLRLVPKAHGPQQRTRMLAFGIGIPLWFLLHLLARLSDADAWQFVTRVLLGMGVAIAVYVAYRTGPRPGRAATAVEEGQTSSDTEERQAATAMEERLLALV